MALYAIDDIDDAIDATKSLLVPFRVATWLRLAVVVFFLGGAGSNLSSNVPSGPDLSVPDGGAPPIDAVPDVSLALVAAVVAVVLAVVLAFAVIGAIMEFVLVETLRSGEIHVRRYARRYWGEGLRLFAFRAGLWILGILTLAAVAGALWFLVLGGSLEPLAVGRILGGLALLVPALLVVVVVFALIQGFTTTFVVPVMLLEDRGVLSAWGRFWPTLRAAWKQYLAYAVFNWILHIAAGIITGLLGLLVMVVVAVPFAALAFVAFLVAGGTFAAPVLVVLAVLGAVFFVLFLLLGAVIRVPFTTFFRYYALFVMGDTDEDLDLIPDRRAAVRA